MKTIRSNKKGRRIHSPYVYRLVANVLFAPYPYYASAELKTLSGGKNKYNDLEFIFRLINHFGINELAHSGQPGTKLKAVGRLANPIIKTVNFDDEIIKPRNHKTNNRLVLTNPEGIKPGYLFCPEFARVWVINGINNKKGLEVYKKLKLHEGINISIQLKNLGILIYNEKIEKQDYVINY